MTYRAPSYTPSAEAESAYWVAMKLWPMHLDQVHVGLLKYMCWTRPAAQDWAAAVRELMVGAGLLFCRVHLMRATMSRATCRRCAVVTGFVRLAHSEFGTGLAASCIR